jgi:curved DNA-binding protein CbpA
MATKFYEVLGVTPGASTEEIKAAFKAKAKQSHPDMVGGDADLFRLHAYAHEVLTDTEQRALYDRTGEIQDERIGEERKQALGIVENLLSQTFNQIRPDGIVYDDVVAKLALACDEVIAQIEGVIGNMRAEIAKLTRFAERFTAAGETNVIAGMVKFRAEQVERAIPKAEKDMALHRLAAEILREHSFAVDAQPTSNGLFIGLQQQREADWGQAQGRAQNDLYQQQPSPPL